ncbi:MAG: hypothetical protein WCX28_09180 [Bacteriovoracaceae bacterium]|nr:hypothetical protein [Bacteroidota bacterium]
MNWLYQVEIELQRIRPHENPGRTRTTARRIAGIALQYLYRESSTDFLKLLHTATRDDSIPQEVREAINRLVTRLDSNFQSLAVDPINDALIVVQYVKQQTP